MKIFLLAALLSVSVLAQDKPKTQPPAAPQTANPPVIPMELLKNFYAADADQQRAQREVDAAKAHAQSASAVWQQAVIAMQKVCGDKYELYQDSINSDPQCRIKTKPSATPEKK